MEFLRQKTDPFNEIQDGRILSDDEYARALANRDDIFLINNERILHVVEICVLALGFILGMWLSTFREGTVDSDFYQKVVKDRLARLASHRDFFPDSQPPPTVMGTVLFQIPVHATALRKTFQRNRDIAVKNEPKQSSNAPPQVSVSLLQGPVDSIRQDAFSAAKGGDDLLAQAIAHKKSGNYAEALTAFKNALKSNPRDAQVLAGAGDMFLYTENLDSAEAFYKSSLAIDSNIASAHNGLGTVLYYHSTLAANPNWARRMNVSDPKRYKESQSDGALAEYTRAFSLDSSLVDALTNRGVLRDIRGEREEAIRDYTLALKINPSYAEAFTKRGSTYKSLHRYRESLADYSAAIKLDSASYEFNPRPHFANAYFGRAIVYHKMGDFDNAVKDFDSALALCPNHSLALLNKAIALDDGLQFDSAVSALTKAIAALSPSEYDGSQKTAYLLRGNAYKKLGRLDDAIADYLSAMDLPKVAAKACRRIAECYSLKKDESNAVDWLRKSVSRGFSDFNKWKNDSDLSFLRNNEEFRRMTGM